MPEDRKSFVRELLTNYIFAVSQGMAAGAAAPRGRSAQAAMAAALGAPMVQQNMERERQSQKMADELTQQRIQAQNAQMESMARDVQMQRIGQQPQGASFLDPANLEGMHPDVRALLGTPGLVAPPRPMETDPGIPSLGVRPQQFRPPMDVAQMPQGVQEALKRQQFRSQTGLEAERAGAVTGAQEAAKVPFREPPKRNLERVQIAGPDGPQFALFDSASGAFTDTTGNPIPNPKPFVESKTGSFFQIVDESGQVVFYNPLTRARVNTGIKPPAGKSELTSVQSRAAKFLLRATSAHATAIELENFFKGAGTMEQLAVGSNTTVANWFKSDEGQRLTQAQREFTEARLRDDSGAAIPDSEFENDRQTYFPVAGNTEGVIAQKRKARQRVLDSLQVIIQATENPDLSITDEVLKAYKVLAHGDSGLAVELMKRDGLKVD